MFTVASRTRLRAAGERREAGGVITDERHLWGEWTDIKWCPAGILKSFRLKVESSQGDDTAANDIKFYCTGGAVLEGAGTDWGEWGFWSPKCLGKGICGIQTLVEESQGSGDDTTLNDVRMFCWPLV
ncbi:unnamed protein product [Leuciscus chuanchicus]